MKYQEFYKLTNGKYRKAKFTNEHDEDFIIVRDGLRLLITGDELNWEMHELFNPSFNIYSAEELLMLADALKELDNESKSASRITPTIQ